jgi:hypothetical protein
MKIEIRGKPDKVKLDEIREAVKWYAVQLMGCRLAKNINLRIIFKDNLRYDRCIWAECDCRDRGPKLRKFTIWMDANSARNSTLITLAHEMVHVKQFARRELVELKNNTMFRWYGKLYGDEVHYYEQPWEIEAHGREYGLYYMWRESRKNTVK